MKRDFTISNTNFIKGLAMCLMILHHLFANVSNLGVNVSYMELSQSIGIIGKVCVPIFLILSGYGLSRSVQNNYNIWKFYKKQLLKLYTNYWFTITICFIVGFIFFKGIALNLLGDHPIKKIIFNFSGLHYLTGDMGYNSSWWFITVIVILYLLFPVIKFMMNKSPYIFLMLSSIFMFPEYIPVDILYFRWVAFNFFPFILGVFLSEVNFFQQISTKIENKSGNIFTLLMIICLFFFIIPIRVKFGMTYDGYRLDNLLSMIIIIISFLYLSQIHSYINKTFEYIGVYSMDMYLIHGFITTLYTAGFTYSLRNPILMFAYIVVVSLIISVIISKIKNLISRKNMLNIVRRSNSV